MKSFWFKNSTFTFCVWVLGQVDHCDENFEKWSTQKYARILVLWLSDAIGLGGVWVPTLVGNDLPRHNLSYLKGLMKFGCQEPSKKMFDFWNFCLSKRRLTWFIRASPYKILVFVRIFFLHKTRILNGVKNVLPFSKLKTEKISKYCFYQYHSFPSSLLVLLPGKSAVSWLLLKKSFIFWICSFVFNFLDFVLNLHT